MDNLPITTKKQPIKVLGVRVDNISVDQLLRFFENCVNNNKKVIISNVNIHALNIAYSTPWFRNFLNASSVTFCDGFGVRLAARLTGQNLSYRNTPPDFIECIAGLAHKSGWKIFFLGAKPGVAQHAADKIIKKFPGLQIATQHGYFNKIKGSDDNNQVIAQINKFHPQLLILGFGMPLQESWILENIDDLHINAAFTAGALFDYIAGEIRRPPRWMTDHGLEWLGRLMIEPRRLWRRYLLGNPLFIWRVFVHHCLKLPLPSKFFE
jgi:N-acetylglucosaminyldiphosphoundecaprenol N-acetyl-beta-D-mannosaminyltransferase